MLANILCHNFVVEFICIAGSASVIDNGYFTVTVPMPDYFGDETDVQALRLYFRNLAPKDEEAIIPVDSVYLGPKATLPKPLCTVTFVDDNGTVLDEQKVPTGDAVTYKGSTPEKNPDQKNQNYVHQLFRDLRQSLEAVGVEDIFERNNYYYSLNPEKLDCDYYAYLKTGKPEFRGEYMSQYSWAEGTCGLLWTKRT